MSVLRNLEDKIAGLVEGTFGRLFRTEVRPVELANKLVKEMDQHRTVSVSRTYVPNRYVIWLSSGDRERYAGVEADVIDELAGYLLEHARRESLVLTTAPQIEFRTDEQLSLGEFGIQVGRSDPAAEAPHEPAAAPGAPPSGPPAMGQTMVYSSASRHQEALQQSAAPRTRVVLVAEGKRIVLPQAGGTIGRSRDCEAVLSDANVSRRHAEIVRGAAGGWAIRDLGSTNGLRVNGQPVAGQHPLHPGDRVEIGTVPATFEVE